MDPRVLLVFLSLFTHSLSKEAHPPRSTTSKIAVMGFVYCDICSNNTFSYKHGYFLPGVKVHINCKFNAISASTTEQISFSVNRTTDKYGMYKLEVPSVEGIKCAEGLSVQSFCEASLIESSSSSCNVPGLKTTSDQIAIKSKRDDQCFYSLNALNFRPPKRDANLCGEYEEGMSNSVNSAKFFLPFYPPFGFPWPPLPQYPPFPTFPFPPLPPFPSFPFPPLPPFPSFPFPPLPYYPFPPLPPFPPMSFPKPPPPPSLPFPFPPLPPLPPLSPLPPLPPLPPLFSPSPPAFNLLDPRTWIHFFPPSPPRNQLKDQHP